MSKRGAPYKEGLNYYPVSEQEMDLKHELDIRFGHLGSSVYDTLMSAIFYKKGYYFQFFDGNLNENEKEYRFTLVKMGFETKYHSRIKEIIQYLIHVKQLFDPHYFNSKGILTSYHIQRYYFWVITRRKELIYKEEYLLEGMKDFIQQLIEEVALKRTKRGNTDEVDEAEEIPDMLLGIGNVQNEPRNENGIVVDINSKDVDSIAISADNNLIDVSSKKQSEAKRSEEVIENSIEFSVFNKTTLSPVADMPDSKNPKTTDKKKPRTPPAYRQAFIKAWQDFTGMTLTTGSAMANTDVNNIVHKTLNTVMSRLKRENFPEEKCTEENLAAILGNIYKTVFSKDQWAKMPYNVKKSLDVGAIEKRWETIFLTVYPSPQMAEAQKTTKKREREGWKKPANNQRRSFEEDY